MKFFDDERQTHFFLFVVRYAGVGVYVDVTGGEDLGMDCSALTVCLIGMLDDVYLDRKLSTMYTICRVRSRGQLRFDHTMCKISELTQKTSHNFFHHIGNAMLLQQLS